GYSTASPYNGNVAAQLCSTLLQRSANPFSTYPTMRIPNPILAFTPFLALLPSTNAYSDSSSAGGGALYPPGLQPLISRANTLLSLGQFSDAAKAYSEAI